MYVCKSVALGIQHEERMCRVIWLSVDYLAVSYFSTLSHKFTIFGQEDTEINKFTLTFSISLSETFLILRRIQRDILINIWT